MKEFIVKNKVLLIALLSALLLVTQQVVSTVEINYIAIAYAAAMALLGVLANEWKGGGITVTGIIGTVSYAFIQVWDGSALTWKQFGTMAATAFISALISSLKSYNNDVATPVITPTAPTV